MRLCVRGRTSSGRTELTWRTAFITSHASSRTLASGWHRKSRAVPSTSEIGHTTDLTFSSWPFTDASHNQSMISGGKRKKKKSEERRGVYPCDVGLALVFSLLLLELELPVALHVVPQLQEDRKLRSSHTTRHDQRHSVDIKRNAFRKGPLVAPWRGTCG